MCGPAPLAVGPLGWTQLSWCSLPVKAEEKRPGTNEAEAPLVVHVVRQFHPNRGGLEDVVANLGRAAIARGWRVRVVTLDRLFTDAQNRLPAHEMLGEIEIVRIAWRGSSRYPLAPGVYRHLRDASVVHVHAVDFFFDALALGRFLYRRPAIATTHGGFFHTPKHALIKKIWFRALTALSARLYDRLVCCSRSDMALFAPLAPSRTVLIENGADVGKFRASASQRPVKRLATIGRFSSNKRLDRLLDAMKALMAADGEWRLDIVGVPGDVSLADLQAMITARGLEGCVEIHCDLENDAIAHLLGQVSLFISASEYEGFGLVAIEAMSAGLLPVLNGNDAFRLLAERHGQIGIADFSQPEAAARAVGEAWRRLCEDPEGLRARLQAEAEDYSWERVAGRYLQVYDEAMHARGEGKRR